MPECNQKGYKDEKNDKISYFNFPTDETRRKQWLHAIRRDVGKDFLEHVENTPLSSLYREDKGVFSTFSVK